MFKIYKNSRYIVFDLFSASLDKEIQEAQIRTRCSSKKQQRNISFFQIIKEYILI